MLWARKMALATANQFMRSVSDSDTAARVADHYLPWDTEGEYGGWWGPMRFEEPQRESSSPTIFIHGKGADADDWSAHAPWFASSGHAYSDLWAITFRDPISRHEEMASQLDAFVRRVREITGAETVNVVAHSLGVTGARHWLHTRERHGWVDTFVGLAGANHGIPMFAHLDVESFEGARREVCQYLNPKNDTGVMQLNRDETPGDIEYYTIRGVFDHYFVGNLRSPCLAGAEKNVSLPVSHNGTRVHASAMRRIEGMLWGNKSG